jgi:hypothetical protein
VRLDPQGTYDRMKLESSFIIHKFLFILYTGLWQIELLFIHDFSFIMF